jgi:hypothetical protein
MFLRMRITNSFNTDKRGALWNSLCMQRLPSNGYFLWRAIWEHIENEFWDQMFLIERNSFVNIRKKGFLK